MIALQDAREPEHAIFVVAFFNTQELPTLLCIRGHEVNPGKQSGHEKLIVSWPGDQDTAEGFQFPLAFAVLVRYQIPENHFNLYVFFATTGIDIGYVLVSLLVGCIAAIAAKERGMAAATTLSLIFAAMTGVAVVNWVAEGHYWFLWRQLTWNFADLFAILIGGAIVRTHLSAHHVNGNENLRNT